MKGGEIKDDLPLPEGIDPKEFNGLLRRLRIDINFKQQLAREYWEALSDQGREEWLKKRESGSLDMSGMAWLLGDLDTIKIEKKVRTLQRGLRYTLEDALALIRNPNLPERIGGALRTQLLEVSDQILEAADVTPEPLAPPPIPQAAKP